MKYYPKQKNKVKFSSLKECKNHKDKIKRKEIKQKENKKLESKVNAMGLTHVIATRLNLNRGHDEEWTKKRLPLLWSICAPSVRAQKIDCHWIILVGEGTPTSIRNQIISKLTQLTNKKIAVITCQNFNSIGPMQEYCRKIKSKWIATTRLDSDDALHPDYLKDIDLAARPKVEVLSFQGGYILQKPENTMHTFKCAQTNFQTLVELTHKAKTAYAFKHQILFRRFPYRILPQFPRWLVLHHDNNWNWSREKGNAWNKAGPCQKPKVPLKEYHHFGFLGIKVN